jgi:hypothetical protein
MNPTTDTFTALAALGYGLRLLPIIPPQAELNPNSSLAERKDARGNAFLKTLAGKKLGSELSQELRESLENPVVFNVSGVDPGRGHEAETLVEEVNRE